ncbi:hypothetical protein IGI96_003589 [Enterococcus sp. DIV0421]
MMDDGWGEIIGSWLEEDLRLRENSVELPKLSMNN